MPHRVDTGGLVSLLTSSFIYYKRTDLSGVMSKNCWDTWQT